MARNPVKYKLYDKGELVGEFTCDEIMKKLNIKRNTLNYYVSHSLVYQERYIFESVHSEPEYGLNKTDPRFIEKFAEEWNAMCLLFSNGAVYKS